MARFGIRIAIECNFDEDVGVKQLHSKDFIGQGVVSRGHLASLVETCPSISLRRTRHCCLVDSRRQLSINARERHATQTDLDRLAKGISSSSTVIVTFLYTGFDT